LAGSKTWSTTKGTAKIALFSLTNESDEEAEDEDFVLTKNAAEEPKGEEVDKKEKKDKEEESDVIATAGTKQPMFFISILIARFVATCWPLMPWPAFSLVAKSLRVVCRYQQGSTP
jgi:hypothetical protein